MFNSDQKGIPYFLAIHHSTLTGCGKTLCTRQNFFGLYVWDKRSTPRRMLKKAGQQGRSERRGEASLRYVEPLSDARTPLADFFSILLNIQHLPQRLRAQVRKPLFAHAPRNRRFGVV
jgi:hypothetical protein